MRTTVEELRDPQRVRVTITNDAGDSVTVEYPPDEADDLGRKLIAAARMRDHPMSEGT